MYNFYLKTAFFVVVLSPIALGKPTASGATRAADENAPKRAKTIAEALAHSSWQEIYDQVFRHSTKMLAPVEVERILRELKARMDLYHDRKDSIPANERAEVEFWLWAGLVNTSMCKPQYVDTIMRRVGRTKTRSSDTNDASAGTDAGGLLRLRYLNLAVYAMSLLEKRTHFCNTYERWLDLEETRARHGANLRAISVGAA